MVQKSIVFIIVVAFYVSVFAPRHFVAASVNCLLITPNSSENDKDYCKKELANIEAQLVEL